jgi:hypothetical protein
MSAPNRYHREPDQILVIAGPKPPQVDRREMIQRQFLVDSGHVPVSACDLESQRANSASQLAKRPAESPSLPIHTTLLRSDPHATQVFSETVWAHPHAASRNDAASTAILIAS